MVVPRIFCTDLHQITKDGDPSKGYHLNIERSSEMRMITIRGSCKSPWDKANSKSLRNRRVRHIQKLDVGYMFR